MLLAIFLSSAPDTALPKGSENLWYYSSCCMTAGAEVLGYYASASLGGMYPMLIGAWSGGLGCLAYTAVAYQLTPVPELKPKAAKKALGGGTLGMFTGTGAILLSIYLGLL